MYCKKLCVYTRLFRMLKKIITKTFIEIDVNNYLIHFFLRFSFFLNNVSMSSSIMLMIEKSFYDSCFFNIAIFNI